ncbi:di-trans,poly-cis-decaprenylcistransferase [bacterium]|nr:di-trans,poly-cis-decaprenylcistransferase [bacterium]
MSGTTDDQIAFAKTLGINPESVPAHVAIVMDGNGRWAKKRLMPRIMGHRQGAESLRSTIKACGDVGVKFLSVYVFSTENWKRSPEEVSFLMGFMKEMFAKETPKLHARNVRMKAVGDLSGLSQELRDQIDKSEELTASNTLMQFNLLINYGSRRELVHAMEKLALRVRSGESLVIDEALVSDSLYTAGIPDPDIVIRTGGDTRISNFLLWQSAYAEFFFLEKLWPDFSETDLFDVIKKFQARERRFGGVTA